MPVGGAAVRAGSRSRSQGPKSKTRRRRKRSRKFSRPQTAKIVCTFNLLIASLIATSIFLVGLVISLVGYHSSSILDVPDWDESAKPGKYKDKLSSNEYILLQILYNMRFVGPVVMGMGGFIMLCVCVVIYNERDRIETGQSKMISSDDDIYNKAIQDYLEREESSKGKYRFLDNPGQGLDSVMKDQDDSLSYRSASFCSMNSISISKLYLDSESQHVQLIHHQSNRDTCPSSISGKRKDANGHTSNHLAIPKLKTFTLALRNCSSDSEDVDRLVQSKNHVFFNRQSTTSSSSPTLNLSEYTIAPFEVLQTFQQIQSSSSSYNHLGPGGSRRNEEKPDTVVCIAPDGEANHTPASSTVPNCDRLIES